MAVRHWVNCSESRARLRDRKTGDLGRRKGFREQLPREGTGMAGRKPRQEQLPGADGGRAARATANGGLKPGAWVVCFRRGGAEGKRRFVGRTGPTIHVVSGDQAGSTNGRRRCAPVFTRAEGGRFVLGCL
ncbi:hypothetical protein ERJ75_001136800 [Trypanosoma vivax]|nr:hypothetical protein ERJ75_001136800 [Trypanosoma vivax]